jgi:hypothetical protein
MNNIPAKYFPLLDYSLQYVTTLYSFIGLLPIKPVFFSFLNII